MDKSEVLLFIERVLEKIEIEGVASEREFQLAVLMSIKLLLMERRERD